MEPNAKMHQDTATENGHTRIFRADNETDFIGHIVERMIADFDLAGRVTSTVTSAGDGFTRVAITYAHEVDADKAMELGQEIDAALVGKGWYDCREQGQNDEGTEAWYVVKHKAGPWM